MVIAPPHNEFLLRLHLETAHPRSPRWPTVRDHHLAGQPVCQVCGGKEHLNVHHMHPYHLFPALELADKNLLTLCEGSVVNCHLLFGHLRDWRAWNPDVLTDAKRWREKIASRPLGQ